MSRYLQLLFKTIFDRYFMLAVYKIFGCQTVFSTTYKQFNKHIFCLIDVKVSILRFEIIIVLIQNL